MMKKAFIFYLLIIFGFFCFSDELYDYEKEKLEKISRVSTKARFVEKGDNIIGHVYFHGFDFKGYDHVSGIDKGLKLLENQGAVFRSKLHADINILSNNTVTQWLKK